MRVFVNGCDTYVGNAIGSALAAAGHEVVGTLTDEVAVPKWLREAILTPDMNDESATKLMMDCSAVIVDLEGCEGAARSAVMKMANEKLVAGNEKVFIGISNLLTWAATTLPDNLVMERPELPISGEVLAEVGLLRSKSGDVGSVAAGSMAAGSAVTSCAQTAASGAARPTSNATARAPPPATPSARGGNEPGEEQQSGEEEAEGGEAEGAPPIVPERFGPLPLTGFDYERRHGAVATSAITAAENCILRAKRKNKLFTYIICPGILYGRGERDHMGLHHFFKSAYEGQAVRAYGPGTNFLPTVHVDDLASYCIEVIQSKPPDQYLLVADDGQITLGQFVQELSTKFGCGEIAPVSYEDLIFQTGFQYLRLNLPFKLSPIGESVPALKYPEGLVARLPDIYQEYIETRRLQPLRVLLRGGPASGKTHIARKLARHYNLEHVDAKAILEHRHKLEKDDVLRQEVEAQLSSKEPRVSDKNMALLAYKLLTALRISHKGYILDGFPRNLRAAKWLLTKEKPMTEEELEDFQKDRQEGQAEAEATSKGGKRKDKGGKGGDKGGKGGKAAPDEDVPEDKPRTPALEVLPNFAITLHLPAGIAEKRTAALFEAEQQELQKLIEEGKVDPKKPGPPSHHEPKGFQRRLAAWQALRQVDEQHLQQMKDEIKAAHDAEVKEYEARKAEYEAAVAAAAEAENEANAENRPEEGGGQLPEMPVEPPEPAYPKHGGLDKLLIDMEVEVVNMDVWEEPPKVGPTKSLQFMNRDDLLEGDGDKAKKDHGKEENLEEMSEEEKAARNKAEFEKQSVLRQQRLYQGLLALLGEPRNYEGPQAEAVDAQLSSAAPPQPPPTSSQAPPPLKMMDPDLCPKQQGEAYTAGYTKMKEMDQERMSVPIKRYLAQNVMPTVVSALVEVCRVRPADPLEYVGNFLLEAGRKAAEAHVDPYESEIYAIQAEKVRAKAERDKIRAAEEEARNTRDKALREELDSRRATSRGLPYPPPDEGLKDARPGGAKKKPISAKSPKKKK